MVDVALPPRNKLVSVVRLTREFTPKYSMTKLIYSSGFTPFVLHTRASCKLFCLSAWVSSNSDILKGMFGLFPTMIGAPFVNNLNEPERLAE